MREKKDVGAEGTASGVVHLQCPRCRMIYSVPLEKLPPPIGGMRSKKCPKCGSELVVQL